MPIPGACKYDLNMYASIVGSFDTLPLAAIINKSFFCVHGGLSPDITTVREDVDQPAEVLKIRCVVRLIDAPSPLPPPSPLVLQLQQIKTLNRFQEIPREGPMW